MTEGSGAGSTVETFDTDKLGDPYLGIPAALSVLQNELNRCGLPGAVHAPLAIQITAIREGVINLQQTLLQERKADMWVADAWVSRTDLEAALAEIERLKAAGFGGATTGCGALPSTVTVNQEIWMILKRDLEAARAIIESQAAEIERLKHDRLT